MASGDVIQFDPSDSHYGYAGIPGGGASSEPGFEGIQEGQFAGPDPEQAGYGQQPGPQGEQPDYEQQQTRANREAHRLPPIRHDQASAYTPEDWAEYLTTALTIEDWAIVNGGATPKTANGDSIVLYEDHITPVPSLEAEHTQAMFSCSEDVREAENLGYHNLIIGRECDTHIEFFDPNLPPVAGSEFNSEQVLSIVNAERGPGKLAIQERVAKAQEAGEYTQYAVRGGRRIQSMIIATYEDRPTGDHPGTRHEFADEGWPYDQMWAERAGIFLTSECVTPVDLLFVKPQIEVHSGLQVGLEFGLLSSKLEKEDQDLVRQFGDRDGLYEAIDGAHQGLRHQMAALWEARPGETLERILQVGLEHATPDGAKFLHHLHQQTIGANKIYRERILHRFVMLMANLDEQIYHCQDVKGGLTPTEEILKDQRRDSIYEELIQGALIQTKLAAKAVIDAQIARARGGRQAYNPYLLEMNGFSLEDFQYFQQFGKIGESSKYYAAARHWYKKYGADSDNAELQLVVGPPLGPDGNPMQGSVFTTREGMHLDPSNPAERSLFTEGGNIVYGGKGMSFISPSTYRVTDEAGYLRRGLPHMNAGGIGRVVAQSQVYPNFRQALNFYDIKEMQASAFFELDKRGPLLNPNGPLYDSPLLSTLLRTTNDHGSYIIKTDRETIDLTAFVDDGSHFAYTRSSDNSTVDMVPTKKITQWQRYMWSHGRHEDQEPPEPLSAERIGQLKSTYCIQIEESALPDPNADAKSVVMDHNVTFYELNDEIPGFRTMVPPNENPNTIYMTQQGGKLQ